MIVWIDGTFGAGKTAVANELANGSKEADVIDFDEFIKNVEVENPLDLLFGKCYPEDKQCNIDAFAFELENRLKQDDKRVLIIPIALITDYCRDKLIKYFKGKTETIHIILCTSKEILYERIKNQAGRNADLVKTYYDEATLYLKKNYLDAIRINTDSMTIKEVASFVRKNISVARRQ